MNETVADIGLYGSIGGLLPLLLAILNRPNMPAWLKQTIMVVVAALVGALAYGADNGWDFSSTEAVLAAVVGVVGATQIAYRGLWRHGASQAIERNVNAGRGAPAAIEASPTVDEEIYEADPSPQHADEFEDDDADYIEGDDPDAYVDGDSDQEGEKSGDVRQ